MASEIKVDTISEKTGANGVTIDGVNIKDSALATAGSVPLTTIDIDGGTDIGAAIVDADLFIIDDGAGGTNRKTTASRLKTYAGTTINNATANEIVTIASTTTELDAEANLTFDGSALQCTATLTVGVDDTGHDVKFFGATASSYMLWDESADDLNLIASGLGVVSAKDLGAGIHIKTADTGASSGSEADELVIEGTQSGISILSANDNDGSIFFGDDGDGNAGRIVYNHSNNNLRLWTNANLGLEIDSTGAVTLPDQPAFAARPSGTQDNLATSTSVDIAFATEVFDQNADFSTPSFTAPVGGRYLLVTTISLDNMDSASDFYQIKIVTSNREWNDYTKFDGLNDNYWAFQKSVIADMDASDTAKIVVYQAGGTAQADVRTDSYFCGCLLA